MTVDGSEYVTTRPTTVATPTLSAAAVLFSLSSFGERTLLVSKIFFNHFKSTHAKLTEEEEVFYRYNYKLTVLNRFRIKSSVCLPLDLTMMRNEHDYCTTNGAAALNVAKLMHRRYFQLVSHLLRQALETARRTLEVRHISSSKIRTVFVVIHATLMVARTEALL